MSTRSVSRNSSILKSFYLSLGLALLGCANKGGQELTGSSGASPVNSASSVAVAAAPSASSASSTPLESALPAAPPPNLKLTETAPIPGTPVSLKLPPGFKRVGRTLLFRNADKDPISVRLVLANVANGAETMLTAGMNLYKMNQWFIGEGEMVRVSPDRDAYYSLGKMTRDAGGLVNRPSRGLMGAYVQDRLLVSLLISFPASRLKVAKEIAQSLVITQQPADQRLAYGVSYEVPTGFHLVPQMFEPVYFYPVGKDVMPPSGPSLELRFRQSEELERTFEEMIPAFTKDPKSAQCTDLQAPDTGKVIGRDCSVMADQNDRFRIRLWGVKDEHGATIAIIRTPLLGAEAESAAFDRTLKSLKFGAAAP